MVRVNLEQTYYGTQIILLCLKGLVTVASQGADGPESPCHQYYFNIKP